MELEGARTAALTNPGEVTGQRDRRVGSGCSPPVRDSQQLAEAEARAAVTLSRHTCCLSEVCTVGRTHRTRLQPPSAAVCAAD